MSEYRYHWAAVEWPDADGSPVIQVVRTTKGCDKAIEAAWSWVHKHLAPSALDTVTVCYMGRSDSRISY